MDKKFRKLQIDLPIQPLTSDRPWLIAGLIAALIIFAVIILSYLTSGRI